MRTQKEDVLFLYIYIYIYTYIHIYIYTYIHIYITSSFDRLRWNLWDKKKRERKVIPAKRQKRNEDSLLLTQPIYYLIYY